MGRDTGASLLSSAFNPWPPAQHCYPACNTYAADGPNGPHWIMVGLVPLFDPPRHDTKETIERCHAVRAS